MPVGLPPNVANPLSINWIDVIKAQVDLTVDFFQIPSFHDVYAKAGIAVHDSVVASKSIYVCVILTTRPLYILIRLVSHYLYIVLKILADCTVQHVIIATQEGWKQGHFAFNWFVQFQSGLSRAAVLIEVGVICLLILLCAVQRYIRKKKIVERILNWHDRKRRATVVKYEIFVDSVAQTSMVLALLLPHILYFFAVISLKYLAPTFVRYLATKTFLTAVISLYHPILKTILLVHRWVGIAAVQKKERDDIKNVASSQKHGAEDNRSIFPWFRKKSGTADKYLTAASQNAPQGAKGAKMQLGEQRSVKVVLNASSSSSCCNGSSGSSEIDLSEEVTQLLKYWSVYAFLTTIYLTMSLLPFIGRFFFIKSISFIIPREITYFERVD